MRGDGTVNIRGFRVSKLDMVVLRLKKERLIDRYYEKDFLEQSDVDIVRELKAQVDELQELIEG